MAGWERHPSEGEVASCAEVRPEILFSARSAEAYDGLAGEFTALHQLPGSQDELEGAREVQRGLHAAKAYAIAA